MLETIITTGIGAIIGAAVGGALTAKIVSAVTKVELANLAISTKTAIVNLEASTKTTVVNLEASTKTALENIGKRIDNHEEAFKRVIYRDVCDSCKDGKDERHAEVVRRIGSLEEAFRSCFDDLVGALREQANGR